MKPIAVVVKDKLEFNQHNKLILAETLSKLDGQCVVVEVRPLNKPKKTLEQLAYYYGVALPLIHSELVSQGYDVMGVPITKDQADKIVKHFCSPPECKLKRNMTLEQCCKFLDNCIRWSAETLQIVIPDATNKNQKVNV